MTQSNLLNVMCVAGVLFLGCLACTTYGQSDPDRVPCYGESSTMKRSSGPFNNFDKCQQEEKKLVCTDQSHVKTCIRDIDGKSLWAVCTKNICFYDHACPEVTRDPQNALVVESKYGQCPSCNYTESFRGRLQAYGNVGRECLVISGTSSQPTMQSSSQSVAAGELTIMITMDIGWFFACMMK